MATRINIEGLGYVSVDDAFLQLSPEEQARTVDEIKAQASQSQNKTSNPLVGAYEAGKRALGGIADFAKGIGNDLEANRAELEKRGWLKPAKPDPLGLGDAIDAGTKLNDSNKQTYEPSVTWDEMKSNPLNFVNPAKVAQFGGERAITSIPGMVEAVFSPGTFIMGQTGNIGQDRANNNGQAQPSTTDMLKALPAAVGSQALEKIGAMKLFQGTGLGAAAKGIGAEMLTEAPQSLAEYTGGTLGTNKGFDAAEAVDTTLEGAFSGLTAGTVQRGTVDAVKAAPRAARAVRDFGYSREVKNQAPEQTASDLRVGKMFDDMKASQAKADTGTAQSDDVTFKKVQDRISAELRTAINQLYAGDQIDKETRDRLVGRKDNILKQADQHNRDLSQEDLDVLQSLPLEEPVKQGLTNAFRDLNTITNAAMKKNARGPIEGAARFALPVFATGAGVSNPVAGIATLAAKGSVIAGARKLDNVLGLQTPEILRRLRVAQRRNKGAAVGDTMHFLGDLGANAQAGVNVQNAATAKESASQRLLRAKRRLADNPGLNGFDRYVYDQTGLLPSQVDSGLLKLVKDGQITAEQQKAFYQAPKALQKENQGNLIMDMLNDLAVKGDLSRDSGWQGLRPEANAKQSGGTEGIRNVYAYRQAMSNVGDITSTAQQSAPNAEMRQAVNAIAQAPTRPAKAALFAQIKAANPQHAQWLDTVVQPLTNVGLAHAKQDWTQAAGSGFGARPTSVGTIPGAPGRMGPSLAPDGSLSSGYSDHVAGTRVGRTMTDLERAIPPAERVVSKDATKMADGRDFDDADLNATGPGFAPMKDGRVEAEALVDKLWQESIAESGTAAAKAVKDTSIRPPTAEFIDGALKHSNRVRYWYELSGNIFRKAFDVPGLTFSKIVDAVAGTSGGVEPYPNMKRAISILAEDYQKRPIRTDLRDPDSARKALGDSDIDSLKFGNFSGTMRYVAGDNVPPPLSTNDTQVSSAFGVPGNAFAQSPVLYEVVSRFYNKLRDQQNARLRLGEQPYESWQMQALTWVEERGRKAERKQGVSDDYSQALPRVLEEIKAAGIPLPGGKITAETLSDPRLPNLMSSTRAGFLDTYWGTVETMTKLTPEGAAAYELAQKIKGQPWAEKAMASLEGIQRRAMKALSARRNVSGEKTSIITDLFQSILGGRFEVSRIDPYGYGTFEGDVSPNMRIPTLTRVPAKPWQQLNADQRMGMLAVLGKHLNQAAMASSKFTETTPDQADTFSVFVQNYDGAVDLKSVAELEKSLGYPLNVEQVPNGYTIDINIGGFDTKPTLDRVMEALHGSPLSNQDVTVIPMKYDSDFIMEDSYDDLIKKVKKDADKARKAWELRKANRSGSGKGLPALSSVIAQIKQVARERDKDLAEWTAENQRRSEREEVKRSPKGALSK
jgi:hypothetical protein